MVRPFDVLHIGPQKTATTWMYRCFREHEKIALPETDELHFRDIHYHRGIAWLDQQFDDSVKTAIRIDMTSSYLRSPLAAQRARETNPNARIILCLRDPVERAFSHYWHEKKKNRFNYNFAECLENYDLYCSWIEPGLYATHVQRWTEAFGSEAILMQEFDKLRKDPRGFLAEALAFVGLDQPFEPSVIDRKINVASPRRNQWLQAPRRAIRASRVAPMAGKALQMVRRLQAATGLGVERLSDVPPEVTAELRRIFEPEIRQLECILGQPLPSLRATG